MNKELHYIKGWTIEDYSIPKLKMVEDDDTIYVTDTQDNTSIVCEISFDRTDDDYRIVDINHYTDLVKVIGDNRIKVIEIND